MLTKDGELWKDLGGHRKRISNVPPFVKISKNKQSPLFQKDVFSKFYQRMEESGNIHQMYARNYLIMQYFQNLYLYLQVVNIVLVLMNMEMHGVGVIILIKN